MRRDLSVALEGLAYLSADRRAEMPILEELYRRTHSRARA
jgi:hypothetical protein